MRQFLACMCLGTICALTSILLSTPARADDPLKAMPTAQDSVTAKVKRLTDAQKQAIKVAEGADHVVLSISKTTAESGKAKEANAAPSKRSIVVYASGKLECSLPVDGAERRTDMLTQDELTWLLHLAANECKVLERSTKEIQADLYEHTNGAKTSQTTLTFEPTTEYHLKLAGGTNTVAIPEQALIISPLRSKLGLQSLSSLRTYANFLVARAFLGTPDSREALLKTLNAQLKDQHPDLPPFSIEHLGLARPTAELELSAGFVQELDLGNNQYQRVLGVISRRHKGDEPTISFQIHKFSKYRRP